jgi:hypothetical protein
VQQQLAAAKDALAVQVNAELVVPERKEQVMASVEIWKITCLESEPVVLDRF